MPLDLDWTVLAGLLVCLLPWAWIIRRRRTLPLPNLGFSHLSDLTLHAPGWRVRLASVPRTLMFVALLMFAIATLIFINKSESYIYNKIYIKSNDIINCIIMHINNTW